MEIDITIYIVFCFISGFDLFFIAILILPQFGQFWFTFPKHVQPRETRFRPTAAGQV